MRIRSFLGLLFAVALAAFASYLARHNRELLTESFALGPNWTVTLETAIVIVFLAGFLPVAIALVVDTLRRDLHLRRQRRALREGESLESSYRRAVDLAADGQWARAGTELESFLAGRPEDFTGLGDYGVALRRLGRLREAIDVHRRATVRYPQSVALLYELAADYAANGEDDVARELEARILRDFPGFGLEALRRRRHEAMVRRAWLDAARLHEQLLPLANEAGDAVMLARETTLGQGLDYQRGVGLLEQEKPGEAAAVFRAILAVEPRFIPARIMLGEAELLSGRGEAAVQCWREGYLETGSPVFLQRIEDHFIEEEQPVEAIETLRGLIDVAANDLLPRFFLGRLYHRLEMHDEAERALAVIEDRVRASPTFHFLRARILDRKGEARRALDEYVACLQRLDLGNAEYICSVCQTRTPDWRDYCERCGSWNSIELNFAEESLSAEDLGVREVPVWGAMDDSGEFSIAGLASES